METKVSQEAPVAIRVSWTTVAIGGIMVLLGVLGFFRTTVLSMATWLVVGLIVCGALDVLFGIFNRQRLEGTMLSTVFGGLEVVLGVVLLLISPARSAAMINYAIGGWMILRSVWSLLEYFRLRRKAEGTMLIMLGSMLGLLFSLLFLLMPLFGSDFKLFYLAIALALYGLFRIMYGSKQKYMAQ